MKVFVVGHDWGALIAWYLCLFRPDRVIALANTSVAFMRNIMIRNGPDFVMPIEYFNREYGPNYYKCRFQASHQHTFLFGTIRWTLHYHMQTTNYCYKIITKTYIYVYGSPLQEPGVAEKQFAPAHAKHLMRQMLCHCFSHGVFCDEEMDDGKYPTSPLPPWLTEADIDYFVTSFEKTGFTGAINYYRNFDKNCELAAPWADAKLQVPTKYIVGDGDITYNFPGIQEYIHGGGFKEDVPLLEEVVVISGAGHFIQQERAQEVNDHIYDFIIKF